MWTDIKDIYRSAWAFSLACPLLFLIPVAAEMAQHIAELHIGLYDSFDAAQAVERDPLRLGIGALKVAALSLPGYWFIRYLANGWSGAAARALEPRGLALWGVLFAMNTALQLYTLFGAPVGQVLELPGPVGAWFGTGLALAWFLAGLWLAAWFVAWPLGNMAIGPLRSVRLMSGHAWRTALYMAAGILPMMAVHYALGLGAIGRPFAVALAMQVVDAALVGWLALTLNAPLWFAAKRAAEAKGVSLLPVEGHGRSRPVARVSDEGRPSRIGRTAPLGPGPTSGACQAIALTSARPCRRRLRSCP